MFRMIESIACGLKHASMRDRDRLQALVFGNVAIGKVATYKYSVYLPDRTNIFNTHTLYNAHTYICVVREVWVRC